MPGRSPPDRSRVRIAAVTSSVVSIRLRPHARTAVARRAQQHREGAEPATDPDTSPTAPPAPAARYAASSTPRRSGTPRRLHRLAKAAFAESISPDLDRPPPCRQPSRQCAGQRHHHAPHLGSAAQPEVAQELDSPQLRDAIPARARDPAARRCGVWFPPRPSCHCAIRWAARALAISLGSVLASRRKERAGLPEPALEIVESHRLSA